jgi:hypothetical protein
MEKRHYLLLAGNIMKLTATEKWFRNLAERGDVDQRIYKVGLGCIVDESTAGTDEQIENQIRGIKEVTTVSHKRELQRKYAEGFIYRVYEIKYELVGQQSRDTYRDLTLVPAIEKEVTGVKVIKRGQSKLIDKKVNESWAGKAYSAVPQVDAQPMPHSPSLTIDAVLADWMQGSVQAYDVPMNTNNMAYHVMVPVEELWPLCGRHYRAGKDMFDKRYQDFIHSGPTSPVFVAVGRNGRVKLTGNEDIVWFAKKSGLQELPVFFSYQRQV